ncbi:MAG: SDR family NAD(P)-dependent oxidoreductase, partial [Pseudomonadota bacterium]
DHTVYCGTKFFVHAVSESLRGYLAPHDVRVLVVSPGVIETEVLSGVLDEQTLAEYKANKVRMGGGIGADIVADLILDAYRLPQKALVQEICMTPTRQTF